jgi:hypothetical protein
MEQIGQEAKQVLKNIASLYLSRVSKNLTSILREKEKLAGNQIIRGSVDSVEDEISEGSVIFTSTLSLFEDGSLINAVGTFTFKEDTICHCIEKEYSEELTEAL